MHGLFAGVDMTAALLHSGADISLTLSVKTFIGPSTDDVTLDRLSLFLLRLLHRLLLTLLLCVLGALHAQVLFATTRM